MKIVAEGVETEEQAGFLLAEGCDELQGFLISKPVPEEMVAGLIERFGGGG
jgi:EAL domain-containing protein (putative c-di-GMP-specific phosphodiesterase class I)